MERCQHIPVLHRKQEQAQPEQMRVQCRRCGIATEWSVTGMNQTWNNWAAIMVKESAARETAVSTQDRVAIDNAAHAQRWRAFCRAAGIDQNLSEPDAGANGAAYAMNRKIVRALQEHLSGQLSERRIHDLFVSLRKATKAFALNAKIMLPPEGAWAGETDPVAIADAITKHISTRVSAALEKQLEFLIAARYAGPLGPIAPKGRIPE